MYLMYYEDAEGKKIYTLQVAGTDLSQCAKLAQSLCRKQLPSMHPGAP